jgi:FtsP/CotA-like multicopper oxidase with cupredoxin domain
MTTARNSLRLSRRAALGGLLATAAGPALGQQRPAQAGGSGTTAVPVTAEAREVRHALTLAPAKARLRPTPPVDFDIWGVNGATQARPMRMRLGDTALVSVSNRTDQPVALHWHGVRGHAAVSQHRDAIGHPEHLIQMVRDERDGARGDLRAPRGRRDRRRL